MQKINLLGRVFGRLTVVAPMPSIKGRGMWACSCVCGAHKTISAAHLLGNTTTSCGCFQKESARQRAITEKIGGYKGYRKYKTVEDVLTNTLRVGDCLEWQGPLHTNGYAKIGKTAVFKSASLHREVFSLLHGDRPPVVMHTCDNRKCINPQHLLGGTQQENIMDMHAKGRAINQYTRQKHDKQNN